MGAENPYVGARPFTAAQRVFGRDRERREIVDLVIAERIVLLHAPSGSGKTSLLQGRGGVVDTLRDEGFAVLPLARVGLPPPTPPPENRYLDSLLASLELDASGGEALAGLAAREPEAVGVVLIVDQLEEILTVDPTGEAERVTFFRALGRALESRRLWAILALREEHLGALAPYREAIPTHLRTTYRLDLLGPEAAREAIARPARDAGVPFTDIAAEKLVQELCMVTVPRPDGTAERKLGTSVEPVQLQVVCHRLWLRRDLAAKEISERDVCAVDSVDAALSEYYASALADAARRSGESERDIRAWIERELITRAGVRSQVMRGGGHERGVRDEAVRRLVDAYILRQDTRRGVDWIELAHDRLVQPIVEDNAAWRGEHLNLTQKQAALWEERGRGEDLCLRGAVLAEAERWAASHQGELTPVEAQFLATSRKIRDDERAARVRQRLWLSIVLAVAMLTGALGLLAWRQKLEAYRERRAEWEAKLMASARELLGHDQPAWAMKLLLAMDSGQYQDWVDLANEALNDGGLLITLHGGAGYLPVAAFSPDGTRIVVAALDKTVQVWNADGSGRPIVLSGHTERVSHAAFSPDGTKIVTASADQTVRVWNADGSGTPVVLRGFEGRIYSAVFSLDGTKIAASSSDRTARVWNADGSGTPVVLRGHQARVVSAAFSADGRKVVTASSDKTARVWNADGSGTPIVLQGHTDRVVSASFSPDGTRVVTGAWDKTARVWNADGSGTPVVLKGHDGPVSAAVFSPDGATIATASRDWTARVWDADGSRTSIVLRGHHAPVGSATFSPNGQSIVTTSEDHTVRVWNVDGSSEPIVLYGHMAAVDVAAFSSDGTKIVTGSEDKTVRVWDARGSGEPVADIHGTVGASGVFSPDFKQMAVHGFGDGTTLVRTIDGLSKPIVLRGHKVMTRSAVFSPDGKKIVTASEDHTARVWNADGSGQPIVLRGHEGPVWSAAFSPDGTRIVTASWDGTARVWNADGTGRPIVLRGHEDRVINAVFSPDGRRVLTGSDDATARVWNADGTGRPIVLRGHEDSVQAVAFSLDGRRIVTGSYDNTARVWSVDGAGKPVVLKGHDGPILAATFNRDGKRVATGSDDWTARVWNADGTGRPIILSGHTNPVDVVEFDTSDQRLITVSQENNLKIWSLSAETLRAELANANADCLSPDQRVTYLDENGDEARDRYAACERRHGRVPSEREPP